MYFNVYSTCAFALAIIILPFEYIQITFLRATDRTDTCIISSRLREEESRGGRARTSRKS